MDSVAKSLLETVANLHKIPNGAVSIRNNGKSELIKSSKNIIIQPKDNGMGIDIYVKKSCQGEACHIPAIVTENGILDVAYNDFYVEDGASVTIVAGCGIHNSGCNDSRHDGVHSFHIGKGGTVGVSLIKFIMITKWNNAYKVTCTMPGSIHFKYYYLYLLFLL